MSGGAPPTAAQLAAREANRLGLRALDVRDFAAARGQFEQAVALDPAPQLYLNLAFAARSGDDAAGEWAALDGALALDPYCQLALFQRGDWLARHRGRGAAASAFGQFLATLGPDIPPALRGAADHARAVVAEEGAALADTIGRAMADGPAPGPRIAESIAITLGRSGVYRSQPSGLYIPFLPEPPFFDRTHFGWFAELEAATELIARELRDVLTADAGLEPYVAFGATQPVNQWAALNHSRDWSAYFLYRDGKPVADHCARCPGTAALLARLPLLDLAGRGPTVMFSILRPGVRIPPHTGATNARAVVHLPLVVPPGCGFRVGAQTREWRVGEAWAFDDTIEHEAWNTNPTEARAILILDAWNPYLDPVERDQVARLLAAMESHGRSEDWSA